MNLKNRSLQNGSKSTNHSEERDPLTPLNSLYLFSKTTAILIDGRENATVGGDLNFRLGMLLKGAVMLFPFEEQNSRTFYLLDIPFWYQTKCSVHKGM